MQDRLPPLIEAWIEESVRFLRGHRGGLERLLIAIAEEFGREVTPTTPPDTGTTLPEPRP